ncbi:aconitase X swivel domain-containing protein [Chloroflexota bacterium]
MMKDIVLKGHKGAPGKVEGKALVCHQSINWVASVDLDGNIVDESNDLYGKNVKDSILVFPDFMGTTASGMKLYDLIYHGSAPKGIVITKADSVTLAPSVLGNVPLVHNFSQDPVKIIKTGDTIIVNGDEGTVTVKKS